MENKKMFGAFVWRFLERFGAQLVTFVVSIVLARILDPEVYGTVAIITVIITLLQVFIDSGLGNALIQKKDSDEIDFSTVFYFNVVFCLCLYLIIFFLAPLIAYFYDNEFLTPMIRVLGITIIISGLKNIQQAYVSKKLMFKKFFFSTLAGTLTAAFIGIYMAINGYGAWALIIQQLVNVSVDTLILCITVRWHPKLCFSKQRLKSLFSYGWKLMVSDFIDKAYIESRQLLIGKKYTSTDLAYYNRGNQFPSFIAININTAIDSVLLPVMSESQDDSDKVKKITKRSIKTSTFIVFPIMIGLAVCGKSIISIILTEKWLPAVPFLTIFCIGYSIQSIHTANLNAIKALGRSDLFLKLEIVKKSIGLIILIISMWFGPIYIAMGYLLESLLCVFVNSYPNKKLINYSFKEQFMDIFPNLIITLIMGVLVYLVNVFCISIYLKLIIQVILGVIAYFLLAFVFKNENLLYFVNILFKKRGEKNEN